MLFVFGGHHALGDIPAAAWFCSRIPGGPPLYKYMCHEGAESKGKNAGCRRCAAADVGYHVKGFSRQLGLQSLYAPHLGEVKNDDGKDDAAGHGDYELKKVGNHHTPEAGKG